MLIKATRIRASAGATALARHLTQGEDNEQIAVLRGTIADLQDAVVDARRFNRVYALRHFMIAPQVAMDRQQFEQAARALGDEFGFDPALALVVEHQKARAVADVVDRHWHLVVAETDAATGKVLSSSFSHPRHEKLARLLELEFGHPIVAGAHDIAVLAALRGEGLGDLADRLAGALGHGPKPASAYTTQGHQAAKRNGIDLAQARQHIRVAWASSATGDDFRALLAGHGLEMAAGDKTGVVVIRDSSTGTMLGAANRLAGVRRTELNALLERKHHDHNDFPDSTERRPDDFGRHGNPQARPDHHSGTGSLDSVAHGGRVDVGGPGHAGPAAHSGAAGGGTGQERAGSPSEAGRAGHRNGVAPYDGRGLTEAIAKAGAAIMALAKTGPSLSYAERSRQHLAALETQIRAKIATAEARPEMQISSRLHAARLYRDGTQARHTEMLKNYRAAQERLAAHPEPRRSVADRLLGRQPANTGIEPLEHKVVVARADLVAAEKAAAGGDGYLARVEKSEAAEHAQHLGQMETQRRAEMEMLGEIVMAQRMVRIFPAIVFSGPSFVSWAGGKVERKRRELQNPWAVNIWGVPLDFG